MKFRIRFADQVVGAFIIIAILLVAVLTILIGLNQRWFSKNYYFSSRFNSASGVAPGTDITFKGFSIGKIEGIALNKENTIDVRFYIYDTYIDKVTTNSILELTSSPIPGLGGGLVFYQGKGGIPAAKDSFVPSYESIEAQTLIAEDLVDMPLKDDTISRLLGNANRLMESINRTVNHLNLAIEGRGGGQIRDILSNANGTIASLRASLNEGGDIDNILGQVSTLMYDVQLIAKNVGQMSEEFKDPKGLVPKLLGEGSISTFLSDNDKLYKQVSGLLVQVDGLLVTVNSAAKDVGSMTNSLSREIPKISSILADAKTALQSAQDVMQGLKNNPLLKGGISDKPQQETRLDSLRKENF